MKQSIEVWIFSQGKVLLLGVPEVPDRHPFFWQPVTGGRKAGEGAVEAAVREVEEETGSHLDPSALTMVQEDYLVPIDAELTVSKTVYWVDVKPFTPRLSAQEHESFRWVEEKDVDLLLTYASNKETWKKVSGKKRP